MQLRDPLLRLRAAAGTKSGWSTRSRKDGGHCAKPERQDNREMVCCQHCVVRALQIIFARLNPFETLVQDGIKRHCGG
jgi:hypothetical protein